jgi:hypothetical protein
VPSSIDDVVRDAAERVAAARDIEIVVNPRHPVASECAADYDVHRRALVGLLTLSAELATEPRSLHIVIRPEAPPITRLHIRGAGLPTMFTAIPQAHSAAARVVAAVVKQMSARLFVDAGGLVVIYGHFADDDP